MNNRRKTLIVDAEQQWRMIIKMVMGAIVLVNCMFLISLYIFPVLISHISLLDTLLIALIESIIIGLVFYISVIISHRIAGAAYALIRDFKRIQQGDLTVRTHLRSKDYYREVGTVMCETVAQLCDRIKTMKQITAKLMDQPQRSEDIASLTQELEKQLGLFKTEKDES